MPPGVPQSAVLADIDTTESLNIAQRQHILAITDPHAGVRSSSATTVTSSSFHGQVGEESDRGAVDENNDVLAQEETAVTDTKGDGCQDVVIFEDQDLVVAPCIVADNHTVMSHVLNERVLKWVQIICGHRAEVFWFHEGLHLVYFKQAIGKVFQLTEEAEWPLFNENGQKVLISPNIPCACYTLSVFAE